ncbi:tripartite tricarboxylate transporter TctB family protein [Pollutimonas bauzanensis]|uniref:Putative tricarboxylic transport membrane protein n=1 Tax=Pollutimonas bauzanensis TaxID=658167 RepID=A0A1M5NGC0_9BURK|nr:tripartite tricarboxylate transporter TctB family protein [Pollutimonas bauzanensis]SHG88558.1 putative tricarboxylic transport membrane protein [Pollutimonas bauzanensis]
MKINDALIGLILGIFSILVFLMAQTFPVIPGQNFGASLFPTIIGIGMLLCSLLLIVHGIKNRKTDAPMAMPAWLRNRASVLRFLLIPATLVFYFEAADFLGFLIAASLLLLVLFLAFKVRWPIAIAVAVIGALVIHFMFYSVLMVPLPWGLLEPVAW